MNSKIRLYTNSNFIDNNGIEQLSFALYMPNFPLYFIQDNQLIKILQKPTIEIDELTIDDYMLSRGFKKVLEFDKVFLNWSSAYESKVQHEDIKKQIANIKSLLHDKLMYKIWVYLNILEQTI